MNESGLKVGIMQPYVFPYIGYFQLINAVDIFVFYDDVNYIKGGWINRNKLLLNGKESLFTIPLNNASSFKLIKDTEIHPNLFPIWKNKFLKSIEQSYSKTPFFIDVFPVIEKVFEDVATIADISINSIKYVCDYIELTKDFYKSSQLFSISKEVNRENRLYSICNKFESEHYINMIGGNELYSKNDFLKNGISLSFLKPTIVEYPQKCVEFKPGLSMIDILMNNSIEDVKQQLNKYDLV